MTHISSRLSRIFTHIVLFFSMSIHYDTTHNNPASCSSIHCLYRIKILLIAIVAAGFSKAKHPAQPFSWKAFQAGWLKFNGQGRHSLRLYLSRLFRILLTFKEIFHEKLKSNYSTISSTFLKNQYISVYFKFPARCGNPVYS